MSNGGASEIKTTVERIGRRVSASSESKRITYVESVDEEGTIHKTTDVEKGIFDCGHAGETGAVCHVCGGFTICEACAKDTRFLCHSCNRVCCPACSRESLFRQGVRICRRCGLRGTIRIALGRQR